MVFWECDFTTFIAEYHIIKRRFVRQQLLIWSVVTSVIALSVVLSNSDNMSSSANGEGKSSRTRMTNGTSRPMYNDDAFNSDLDSPVEEQSGKTIPL